MEHPCQGKAFPIIMESTERTHLNTHYGPVKGHSKWAVIRTQYVGIDERRLEIR